MVLCAVSELLLGILQTAPPPPPLSTIVSFIVMHVVMPLAYNINCPIIYLKNHHDCVLQNQEPPDGKYCRIRSWKPLGTFTVCINNKTLITYATN